MVGLEYGAEGNAQPLRQGQSGGAGRVQPLQLSVSIIRKSSGIEARYAFSGCLCGGLMPTAALGRPWTEFCQSFSVAGNRPDQQSATAQGSFPSNCSEHLRPPVLQYRLALSCQPARQASDRWQLRLGQFWTNSRRAECRQLHTLSGKESQQMTRRRHVLRNWLGPQPEAAQGRRKLSFQRPREPSHEYSAKTDVCHLRTS